MKNKLLYGTFFLKLENIENIECKCCVNYVLILIIFFLLLKKENMGKIISILFYDQIWTKAYTAFHMSVLLGEFSPIITVKIM